ncbi:MAG TPA: hypothetical protein VKB93_18575 [Thermoanaerobaculia bacterium]|nr:hypothetical protein [Thermoanaerobaculia bacterium]
MSVQVQFTGICTHHRPFGSARHRVVLVHAEHGAYINEKYVVPPHIPKLIIGREHIDRIEGDLEGLKAIPGKDGEWQLCGVQLSLDGTVGPSRESVSTYDDIPRLGAYTDEAPGPSIDVLEKGQAACYFEIADCGTISSERTKPVDGAYYAVWNAETEGTPRLRVSSFWNRQTEPSFIYLKDNASIHISHVGDKEESEFDFLLHFFVLKEIPKDARVPKEDKPARKKDPNDPNDISMGCSNSQYP